MAVETRNFALEPTTEGTEDHGQISGYVAVFNSLSEPLPMAEVGGQGTFREKIKPGAFRRSLERGDNIRALYDHDPSKELGNTKDGTLRLWEDAHGLYMELDLPGDSWAQAIRAVVKEGIINQASFGFRVLSDEWEDTLTMGQIRTLKQVYLSEVTITNIPAYPATKLEAREHKKQGGDQQMEMTNEMITITKKELRERIEMARDAAQEERRQKGIPDVVNSDMEERAMAEYYRMKIKHIPMSTESRNLLDIGNDSGGDAFLPKVMENDVLLNYPQENPLREIITVTNIRGLEVPLINYVSPDMADELEITGDSINFYNNAYRFRPQVKISDSVIHGVNSNLVNTIHEGLASVIVSRERQFIFAENPTEKTQHMSIYHNGIKEVTAQNKYEAVEKALADLPQAIRDKASVVMSFDDYKGVIKYLGTIGLGALASNKDQVFNRKMILVDDAINPVIGDFSCLHVNYELRFVNSDKDANKGIYIFVMPTEMNIKVVIPEAFRVAKLEQSGV